MTMTKNMEVYNSSQIPRWISSPECDKCVPLFVKVCILITSLVVGKVSRLMCGTWDFLLHIEVHDWQVDKLMALM